MQTEGKLNQREGPRLNLKSEQPFNDVAKLKLTKIERYIRTFYGRFFLFLAQPQLEGDKTIKAMVGLR